MDFLKNPSSFNDHGWNIFVSSPVKQWPRTRFECVSSFTMTAVLKSFFTCSSPWLCFAGDTKIVAAFRGMHVSHAKHSYTWIPRKAWLPDRQTDAGQSEKKNKHTPIIDIRFQEKVKHYFLFSVISCIISHVLPQNS